MPMYSYYNLSNEEVQFRISIPRMDILARAKGNSRLQRFSFFDSLHLKFTFIPTRTFRYSDGSYVTHRPRDLFQDWASHNNGSNYRALA
jgi:hypothetical protein